MATKPYGPTDNRFPLEVYTDQAIAEATALGIQPITLDATGCLRVRQPSPIVAVEFHYAINPRFLTVTTANGGSAAGGVTGMAVLQSGAAANGSVLMVSKSAARYLGGTAMFGSWTTIFDTPKANNIQYSGVGTADLKDGFFYGYQGLNFGIIHRVNSVDNFIPQASWNVDPLDGTGPSGIVLNQQTGNVFLCRYLWHGFGPIFFFVLADAVAWQLVHEIKWSNANTTPSLINPTLNLMAQLANQGNATNVTMKLASMGIYAEGYDGQGNWPIIAALGSLGNNKSSITSETSILTIRDKTANVLGGTNTNLVRVKLTRLSLVAAAGATLFRGLLNATVGGVPSFSDWSTNESVIEFDTAGTTTGTTPAGNERFRYFDPTGTGSPQSFDVSSMNIVLNPGDTFTLAASGSTVNPNCSMQWQELF